MQEIYSESLARLFSAENIKIEIKNTPTAYFDIEKRRMTFPKWILQLPVASRELLMLHESSHALHTPEFGTHEKAKEHAMIYKNILNILEDKRIEDAMKEKFPGSKSTFIRGFYELVNRNLFGIAFDEDTQDMCLLDRMNLHFKGDYYFDCEFSEEEQYWVDRAAQNKTFEEVQQNAIELYEWLKDKHAEELMKDVRYVHGEYDPDAEPADEYEDYFDDNSSDITDILSDEEIEQVKDMLDDGREEEVKKFLKNKIEENSGSFEDQESSITDNHWEKNQEKMMSENKYSSNPVNASFPKHLKTEDFIIDNKMCVSVLSKNMQSMSPHQRSLYDLFMSEYKKEMAPIQSHMVREFYRMKAAEDYRRTQESKTGNLDLHKLAHYKYTSDVFLNKSIIKDEKNHGFVLLLDWSGSMSGIMTNAILQLINNVMFCRSIQVPFVAYAFTTDGGNCCDYPINVVSHATEPGDLRMPLKFKLLKLADSSRQNYDEQLRTLFYLGYCFLGTTHAYKETAFERYKNNIRERLDKVYGPEEYDSKERQFEAETENIVELSDLFDLSSTPLNDSLIMMNYLLPKHQKEMNVDVMNLLVITDGDSDGLQGIANGYVDRYEIVTPAFTDRLRKEKLMAENNTASAKDEFSLFEDRYFDRHDTWRNDSGSDTGPVSETDSGGFHRLYEKNGCYNHTGNPNVNDRDLFVRGLHKSTTYRVYPRGYDTSISNYNRARTREWARILKAETGANVVCIELVNHTRNSFKYDAPKNYGDFTFEEVEKMLKDFRTHGFVAIDKNTGYDKIFVVNIQSIGNPKYNSYNYFYLPDDESLFKSEDVDHLVGVEQSEKTGKFTSKSLANALSKNSSVKNKRKFLATRIVELISEQQYVKKEKLDLVKKYVDNLEEV